MTEDAAPRPADAGDREISIDPVAALFDRERAWQRDQALFLAASLREAQTMIRMQAAKIEQQDAALVEAEGRIVSQTATIDAQVPELTRLRDEVEQLRKQLPDAD